MKIDESGLEMEIRDWFGGKKSKQIVNTQGNPINSEPKIQDPTRRKLMKGFGATLATTSLGIGSILTHFDTQASRSVNWKIGPRKSLNRSPPIATSKFYSGNELMINPQGNEENLLQLVLCHMLNGEDELKKFHTVLTREGNTGDETIPRDTIFCETGLHTIAMNTYNWKYRAISLRQNEYDYMEKHFYHQYSLLNFISDFYNQWVRKKNTSEEGTEEWGIRTLFAGLEPYPNYSNIKEKVDKYTHKNTSLQEKNSIIKNLVQKYSKFDLSNIDNLRADRDISGSTNKGPLNNWYRLLNVQTAAFFLTEHYRLSEGKKNPWDRKNSKEIQLTDMENIFWNGEYVLKSKVDKYVRGPPHLW